MKRYLRFTASSLAGMAAAVLLCLPAHAADKVKVSYPTMTSSYIFFFSAIQKGYYKDEGLDLDVVEAAGGWRRRRWCRATCSSAPPARPPSAPS
jgi:ABC-type nitrate/sulfonate/bicarbonate transport system substrate-binding protein